MILFSFAWIFFVPPAHGMTNLNTPAFRQSTNVEDRRAYQSIAASPYKKAILDLMGDINYYLQLSYYANHKANKGIETLADCESASTGRSMLEHYAQHLSRLPSPFTFFPKETEFQPTPEEIKEATAQTNACANEAVEKLRLSLTQKLTRVEATLAKLEAMFTPELSRMKKLEEHFRGAKLEKCKTIANLPPKHSFGQNLAGQMQKAKENYDSVQPLPGKETFFSFSGDGIKQLFKDARLGYEGSVENLRSTLAQKKALLVETTSKLAPPCKPH